MAFLSSDFHKKERLEMKEDEYSDSAHVGSGSTTESKLSNRKSKA